jgi:hypothetical protein
VAVALGREQAVHRRYGGVQVIVEQAVQRQVLVGGIVYGGGKFPGVGPQQIVHAAAAR